MCAGLREDCRKAMTWKRWGLGRYFEGISASYQCLIDLYSTLTASKEEQDAEIKSLQSELETLKAVPKDPLPSLLTVPHPPAPIDTTTPRSRVPRSNPRSPKVSPSPLAPKPTGSRKNTPERSRALEKQHKDLVENHVRQDFELQALRKRYSNLQSELNNAQKELKKYEEIRKKRDEQTQNLIGILKQRDADVARFTRDLRQKEEVIRNLKVEIQQAGVKTEWETRIRLQQGLEAVREMAAVKEGEPHKEMGRNKRKLRDGEVFYFRKQVLSPLNERSPAKPVSRDHSNKRGTNSLNATLTHRKNSRSGDFTKATEEKGRYRVYDGVDAEEEKSMEGLERTFHFSTKEA